MARTVKTLMYIVHYDDKERPADGIRKTRHFADLDHAKSFVARLDEETNVTITQQKTTIKSQLVW